MSKAQAECCPRRSLLRAAQRHRQRTEIVTRSSLISSNLLPLTTHSLPLTVTVVTMYGPPATHRARHNPVTTYRDCTAMAVLLWPTCRASSSSFPRTTYRGGSTMALLWSAGLWPACSASSSIAIVDTSCSATSRSCFGVRVRVRVRVGVGGGVRVRVRVRG